MLDKDTQAVANWLLHSGIQNPDGSVDQHGVSVAGAFNSWFDLGTNRHSYVYSEISGYALTMLLYLHNATQEEIYLERAYKVADWLVATQRAEGGFETALYHPGTPATKPSAYHTFDVGMVLDGLVNMYALTKVEKYLTASKKAAAWLMKYQNHAGALAAQISSAGEVVDTSRTWSTQSGSYHAKIAMGLLNLFSITNEETYKQSAIRLCEYALTRQQNDGQFYTYGEEKGSNLHPFLYSAEGLYAAGAFLKEERYTVASRKAVEWVHAHIQNGLVPRHKHGEVSNYNERVDILSQAYRLFRVFGLTDTETESVRTSILKYQYFGDNATQHGGFLFGKLSDGTKTNHVNCWVTMFALQALLTRGEFSNPFYLV